VKVAYSVVVSQQLVNNRDYQQYCYMRHNLADYNEVDVIKSAMTAAVSKISSRLPLF